MKLPALYLLDSILKNVGHVYTSLFSLFITRVFVKAFVKVSSINVTFALDV